MQQRSLLSDLTTIDSDVFMVCNSETTQQALRMVQDAPVVGVDTESEGPDLSEQHPIYVHKLVSMQLSTGPGTPGARIWVSREWVHPFKGWLEDSKPTKCLHLAKHDMHVLANDSIHMDGVLGDTLIMEYLTFTGRGKSRGLKDLITHYTGRETKDFAATFGKGGLAAAPFPVLVNYATLDPLYTVELYRILEAKLRDISWTDKSSYLKYYERVERPFTKVLFDIERRGCLLDEQLLRSALGEFTERQKLLEKQFRDECAKAGMHPLTVCGLSLGSADDVVKVVEALGGQLDALTDTGKPKTDDEALSKVTGLAKVPLECLLEWRETRKLRTTYVEPFLEMLPQYHGRIHTSFGQTGTVTGRLSSRAPNLQNLPARKAIGQRLREAFIAPKGMVIADIDLAAAEMRIAAHFANDRALIKVLKNGWDPHSLTAAKAFANVREFVGDREPCSELYDDNTGLVKKKFKVERTQAKTVGFATMYGSGAQGLSDRNGIPLDECKQVIKSFFETYPGVQRCIREQARHAAKHGHVRTLFGRYVHIDEEHKAFNGKVQGTIADMMKFSMILIEKDERLKQLGVRQILQVHDELLLEVPEEAKEETKPIVDKYVSKPYAGTFVGSLRVETPAEVTFGRNWREAK